MANITITAIGGKNYYLVDFGDYAPTSEDDLSVKIADLRR